MEYSKQELKEIEELKKKHPVVEKLWVEHELGEEDVSHIFFGEFREMMKCIASDMKLIREGKPKDCKILNSDHYDNVSDMLIKGDKIFSSLQKGKDVVNPEGAAKDKKDAKDGEKQVW